MLPNNTSSSISLGGLYIPPDERVTTPKVDYELGGTDLLDTSEGLFVRAWKVWLDHLQVKLQGDGLPDVHVLFEGAQITEIALTFDQNMRWAVAYVQEGILKLRWYDSLVSTHIVSEFGTDNVNPKMALDDKREFNRGNSDMILAYLRDNALYYRQQRERFAVERMLRDDLYPGTKLKNIGMSRNLRMQFELV